jgi:AcrR family transcriptional regulator
MPRHVKRVYNSPLRRDQAQGTERAVISAATRRFTEQGYLGTSIEDIAADAGVSRATVFNAVGGKPVLLRRAYEMAVRGDDDATPLGRQPRAVSILAEEDPQRLLARYSSVVAEIAPRFAPLAEAIRTAAQADNDASRLWHTIQEERRNGVGRVVEAVRRSTPLRQGLGVKAAGDVLWLLTDPMLYVSLVHERGWSQRQFSRWLEHSMRTGLLP